MHCLVQVALDILVLIVRGCGSVEGGVPTEFVTEVFPCVVQRVLSSDDSAILQVRCMTAAPTAAVVTIVTHAVMLYASLA